MNGPTQSVGIRDLKSRLTHYLRLVKEGEKFVVTDRGKPIASIRPLDGTETQAAIEERLADLAKQGRIRLPLKKGRFNLKTPPIKVKGKPLSQIIIEDRR